MHENGKITGENYCVYKPQWLTLPRCLVLWKAIGYFQIGIVFLTVNKSPCHKLCMLNYKRKSANLWQCIFKSQLQIISLIIRH